MSGLVVKGFQKTVLKRVNIIEKEGKKPLVFVDLMDFETFETTGDLILLNENINTDFLVKLKTLEKKPVKATIQTNTFNGKTSFVAVEVLPA